MSRAERLLDLMQSLRLRRRPVAGSALAEELGVSLRTLYRDIELLKAQGARIEGEAGLGYVLKPGFTLPPLMFSLEEVEALALGARWVEGRADEGLKRAARGALAKIAAVLPPERAEALDWPTLLAGAGKTAEAEFAALPVVREALGKERKLASPMRTRRAADRPGSSGRSRSASLTMRACSPPGARRARRSAISASTAWLRSRSSMSDRRKRGARSCAMAAGGGARRVSSRSVRGKRARALPLGRECVRIGSHLDYPEQTAVVRLVGRAARCVGTAERSAKRPRPHQRRAM